MTGRGGTLVSIPCFKYVYLRGWGYELIADSTNQDSFPWDVTTWRQGIHGEACYRGHHENVRLGPWGYYVLVRRSFP